MMLDHLVLAAPVLADAVAAFEAATGVTPVSGGSHAGFGTANHLVGLNDTGERAGSYLEIVGPDRAQPDPPRPRPFGIDELTGSPRLVTWAVRPPDVDATIQAARARGYDPGDASPMSRRTPAGELLQWRLTPTRFEAGAGLVPFLIDWGSTPHPTTRDLPTVSLIELRATHPRPDDIRDLLAALGVELVVEQGRHATLAAALDTPRGRVALGPGGFTSG